MLTAAPFAMPPDDDREAVPGILWPRLGAVGSDALADLHRELEQTQWLPAPELRRRQLVQIDLLLRHAFDQIPFWNERLGRAGYDFEVELTEERFAAIPPVTRAEIQAAGEALFCRLALPGHGPFVEKRTSGSTATPIRALHTQVTGTLWHAIAGRDSTWHRRDVGAKLAVIRSGVTRGEASGWGPPWHRDSARGRAVIEDVRTDLDSLWNWIRTERPAYLLAYPSIVRALARISLERGARPRRLREVIGFGEALREGDRALLTRAWGVPLTDLYSAEETGTLALQCPERVHYHEQSEAVRIEVLRDDGSRCEAGEIGSVVVTVLHNFAMPLVRYDIGDRAEVGEPCACGRGLPVLRRILGRERNLLTLPDGRRVWPKLREVALAWQGIAGVRQLRLVQSSRTRLECWIVVDREPAFAAREAMSNALREAFGAAFELEFVCVAQIPRGPSGKYEDFVSELA